MTWYALLALVLVPIAFGLGLLTTWVFRRPHAPDRRRGDRRIAQRRTPTTGRHAEGERRRADRRRTDRRRPRAVWPSISVVIATIVLSAVAVLAYAETQVESFFTGTQPNLVGAGWADCETPITWSVDTSRLTPDQASDAIKALQRDFAAWGSKSGLTFTFAGEIPVAYDDSDFSVTSQQHPSSRHIFISFLPNADSSLLDERTVGFAMPSKVVLDGKEIVEGSVVLSAEYVSRIARRKESALYLHEIGHALGLGHGTLERDVMYYIVDRNIELSAADIAGIRALIQACRRA